MTGNERATRAYAETPIKLEGLGLVVVWITSALFGLATITVGLRVYVRTWFLKARKVWGMDDTLALCGYVMFVPTTVFTYYAARHGVGAPDEYLNEFIKIRGIEYNLYWQISYMLLLMFAKASIAIALLRLTIETRYRLSLWAIIITSTAVAVGGVIAVLAMCRPVAATWNPALGTCGSYTITLVASYAMTVVGPVMDFACAIIPYFLLRGLPMRRTAKYALIIILGLGVFASAGTIVRAPYFEAYRNSAQQLYNMGGIALWSNIEGGIGLIAGSLPPLGKLFKRYFGETFRSSTPNNHKIGSHTIGGSPFSVVSPLEGLTPRGKGISSAYVQGGAESNRLDDDDASGTYILQERSVRVVSQALDEKDWQRGSEDV
ncbi:hypothetical protein BKA67DRAFT_664138 [Truncatella angustata]|uniref:Rhodopsin domain-containing protein n=1 Tax=Truncatella angustata TaxID=152316 RepID=A0A9P8UBM9_9PEZI|nr:uncharacterized protein BKA67DRAFT_664138 [Truncatella angustata]KAH6646292.1 hypothetical protein BKA67DRAFT_664138 [Truncatella angustata]KAH8201122.1 hypothetical protein TruAng_004672 [Truncatella angustata]